MPKQGRLIFDGRQFEIKRAEIVGVLPDPYWCDTYNNGSGKSLGWSIRFETKEQESDGEHLSPHVDFDGLGFLKIANWHELLGVSISWSEPINGETGQRYGLTYVWDHQLITKGKLRVTQREGSVFRIIASGENEEGQAFSVDAPAGFVGVYVHGSGKDSDETVKIRLSEQLSLVNLEAARLEFRDKYESGLEIGSAFFTPLE